MNCIIVDDEPLAQDLLEDFINKVPFLKLIKKCKNAFEAIEIIHNEEIDLIYLDIQMPKLSGIQFAESMEHEPMVIFTTAFSKYAVESYNLNAVDYLLKPFTFERFLKATNKAYAKLTSKVSLENKKQKNEFIFVNADYSSVKINLYDILYIEGLKDYIKIYAGSKPILTLQSLKAIQEKLPKNQFIRVHRSFIVSINKIESIQRNRIIIGEKRIPVGDSYKKEFYQLVEKHNL
ncbi:LytR/AlgR family response regulator transcription factor [Bacteroidota bacterium]